MTRRRVVITGLGAVSPCGNDVASTWSSLVEGRSGIGPITRFDATGMPTRIAGEVKGFDGNEVLGKRKARRLGLFMQYALAAGAEAIADAGFSRDTGVWPDPERFGVYVGSGIGGFPEIVEGAEAMAEHGLSGISPFFIPRSLINLATGHLAIEHGAKGPTMCIATACAVGNHSIGEAWRAIVLGDADVILAGGTEASISALGMGGFMSMRALSRRNDEPERASRPFDVGRDGFVMGEGAGLVLLEDYEHAKARGARIYCELTGYGATTDAHHVTAPAPNGEGAARCMSVALRSAGLRPEDIGYINAHGTSTPLNDSHETAAIKSVFGDHAYKLAISSTKSLTGHLLGASGGLEAVATVMSVYTGICPGTANLDHPDPNCDLDYLPGGAREVRPRAAMSNAFGFGGTNATLVFSRLED
ncbi:MAG: beta-ketoacyl-[acyl-carrier-protein] synthase II [Deltaproteobacteria bacterium]|nr:MAG: beta-ketoacyl-[acyl-carrier-protein] synthase II [Deltaproteobacteria bacterium]